MRVLFCGGGTAGHVYPNIAIAEALKKNVPNIKFAYVVTEKGIENQLVDFDKFVISVIGINKGAFVSSSFRFASKMISAIKKSKKIISTFNPDVIIGTGGFATFPVVYAGNKLGIKTVLHESNLVPGRATKLLEKNVSLMLVNYEETKKYFKNKENIVRVGNPLRNEYFAKNNTTKEMLGIDKNKKIILSFGGSLGAKRLNDGILALIDNYLKYQENIQLFFITGKKDYMRIKNQLKNKNITNVNLMDFCYELPNIISCADLVISRAGAMTISELAQSKKCCILVPSPNVTNNHQYKNAKLLSDNESAILIKEDELHKLTDKVKELIECEEKRRLLEENIGEFSIPDTNKRICREILKLLRK